MTLYDSNATVSKVINYLKNSDLRSKNDWSNADISVHNDYPFFPLWVSICSSVKNLADAYASNPNNPDYYRIQPISYMFESPYRAKILINFFVEASDITEVSGYLVNGPACFSRRFNSSSTAQTPYLRYVYFKNPLQGLWDLSRVLDYFAVSDYKLPARGGLGISVKEDLERPVVKIWTYVNLVQPQMINYSDIY